MRILTTLLLVVAVAACAVGGQDEKADKEKKKFAGTWVMVSGQVDGKAVSDEHVKANKPTYEGDKITVVSPHQSAETIKAKLARVDPSKKPHEMDWVRENGPGKEKTMMAIYEWVDDDTYRICLDPSGKERPKEFKAPAGSGYIIHTWKRAKK